VSAALIREAVCRLAADAGDQNAARILADLQGLTPGLVAMVHAKAADLRNFADIMAHSEAHNAPIFAADPSRRI
jgi:hypothetical protein